MTKNLSYAAEQVRQHDPDRFLCALLAPAEKREGLLALYGFELELASIRNKVREPMMALIRLQWWREAIGELYLGKVRGHEIIRALAHAQVVEAVPKSEFFRFIDAHEAEFAGDPFPTGEALLDYAEAIGETSLTMAVSLLSGETTRGKSAGTGVALTNYLRLLPQLAAEGRLLLPDDLTAQLEIDPHILTPANVEQIKIIVSVVADEARRLIYLHCHPREGGDPDLLAQASKSCELEQIRNNEKSSLSQRRLDPRLRGDDRKIDRAVLPAFLPVVLAKHYLKRLAKADYNPFAPQLNAPNPWKPLQLARAWATGRV